MKPETMFVTKFLTLDLAEVPRGPGNSFIPVWDKNYKFSFFLFFFQFQNLSDTHRFIDSKHIL